MTRPLYNFVLLTEDVTDRGWNAVTVASRLQAQGHTISLETVRRALRGANWTPATIVAIAELLEQPIARYKLRPGRRASAVPDGRARSGRRRLVPA